jgi:hypothetical protein
MTAGPDALPSLIIAHSILVDLVPKMAVAIVAWSDYASTAGSPRVSIVRRLGSKPHEGNISVPLKDRAGTDGLENAGSVWHGGAETIGGMR